MSAVTSPAAARPHARRAIRSAAVPGAIRRRGREIRQVGTFAAIGVVSTLAYVALYALMRPFVAPALANAVALVATAIANTAANRRLTFAVRGRAGMARDHAAGLLAFGVALAITSAALAALNVVAPGAPRGVEVVVLVAANAAATLARFALLRDALDRSRQRGLRNARPARVTPDRLLERTDR